MFNNAGLVGAVGPLTLVQVETWDRTYAVLVRARCSLASSSGAGRCKPQEHGGGTIINTASIAGLHAGAGPAGLFELRRPR